MKTYRLLTLLTALSLAGFLLAPSSGFSADKREKPDAAGQLRVYVGTYTRGKHGGVYACELDLESGRLSEARLAAETDNPSFLAVHPTHRFLYAVGELSEFDGKNSGAVNAFSVDPKSGSLTLLNQQPSGGAGPCYVVVDATGKNVLVANYGGGSVACLPIHPDGSLGPATTFIQHEGSSVNPQRQQGPHAHSINLDRNNRFAIAADLGLDKLLVYRFDPHKGTLTPSDPPFVSTKPGGGPRHFALHPNGKFAYANLEITSMVTALRYDADHGVLTPLQTLSTLPDGFDGNNSTAETRVHPNGNFVYVSNRGHNSVAIFAVDPSKGTLTPVGHASTRGKTPRNFNLDPSGRYLLAANQDTNNVVAFRVNGTTGKLTPTGSDIRVPSPVCVRFIPLDGDR